MHVHSHTVIFLWIAILFVQTYTRITLSTDILGYLYVQPYLYITVHNYTRITLCTDLLSYLYALLYFDISMLTTIVKNNKNIF